jgi:hypothetical protein
MPMIEFLKETSESDVPGGITESIVVTFRRLLKSMLVIVGREIVDGRDVILMSCDSDNVDGRAVILMNCDSDNVDGRAVILMNCDSDNVDGRPVILLIVGSERVDGRAVMLIVGSDRVDGKAVMLVIGDDIPEINRRGAEVTDSISMIGWPSGPTLTARLASMTTVFVPLRRVPIGGLPKPCVKVHTPSA